MKAASCARCGKMREYDALLHGYPCRDCMTLRPAELDDWLGGPTHLVQRGDWLTVERGCGASVSYPQPAKETQP